MSIPLPGPSALQRHKDMCGGRLHSQVTTSRHGTFPDGDFGGVRRLYFNELAVCHDRARRGGSLGHSTFATAPLTRFFARIWLGVD